MDKSSGDFFAPMQRTSEAELEAKFPVMFDGKAAVGSLRTALGGMVMAGFAPEDIYASVGRMLTEIQNRADA